MKPLYERILERVDRSGGPDACWPWTGTIHPNGRGVFSIKCGKKTASRWAHRLVFELFCHPIPDDLELDHVCHTRDETCRAGDGCFHRRCCNPAHLEPVTHAENVRRGRPARGKDSFHGKKTHCPQGHPYDVANTAVYDGRRQCIACRTARNRARLAPPPPCGSCGRQLNRRQIPGRYPRLCDECKTAGVFACD